MDLTSRKWNRSGIAIGALEQQRLITFKRCVQLLNATSARSKVQLVMSHTTALELLGVEIPYVERHRKHPLDISLLHACVPERGQRLMPRDAKVHVWKQTLEAHSVGNAVNCVPPVVAWAQMSSYINLTELVVLGDSMMRKSRDLKMASLNDFSLFLQQAAPFHGASACKKALPLMMENTDSSQETRLRLMLMAAGLPKPTINYVYGDPELRQLYSLDLAYPHTRVGIEYDGKQHFTDDAQRNNDAFKRGRLQDLGWYVEVFCSDDLRDQVRFERKLNNLITHLSSGNHA